MNSGGMGSLWYLGQKSSLMSYLAELGRIHCRTKRWSLHSSSHRRLRLSPYMRLNNYKSIIATTHLLQCWQVDRHMDSTHTCWREINSISRNVKGFIEMDILDGKRRYWRWLVESASYDYTDLLFFVLRRFFSSLVDFI
jgi:hypothetical protein